MSSASSSSKRNTREKFAYKQYIHTDTFSTDRASLFLGIFVHLIPLCLVPPNSQLVFFFFFPLFLLLLLPCLTVSSAVLQSHLNLKLILMGAPALLLLLLYFSFFRLHLFCFDFCYYLLLLKHTSTSCFILRQKQFLLKDRARNTHTHKQVNVIKIHAC